MVWVNDTSIYTYPTNRWDRFGYWTGGELFRALTIRQRIPVSISVMPEQHFSEFPEKKTTLRGILKFSAISYQEFLFHLTLLQEFPKFSVEWFAFLKFNNSRIFSKLFQEMSLPFLPVSKFSEFLVEWKFSRSKVMRSEPMTSTTSPFYLHMH